MSPLLLVTLHCQYQHRWTKPRGLSVCYGFPHRKALRIVHISVSVTGCRNRATVIGLTRKKNLLYTSTEIRPGKAANIVEVIRYSTFYSWL